MSADNRICILRVSDTRWAVWHGGQSDEYHCPPSEGVGRCQQFESEKEANAYAEKLLEDIGYVEYGIQYITAGEQKRALAAEINDLRAKLSTLKNTGSQASPLEDYKYRFFRLPADSDDLKDGVDITWDVAAVVDYLLATEQTHFNENPNHRREHVLIHVAGIANFELPNNGADDN